MGHKISSSNWRRPNGFAELSIAELSIAEVSGRRLSSSEIVKNIKVNFFNVLIQPCVNAFMNFCKKWNPTWDAIRSQFSPLRAHSKSRFWIFDAPGWPVGIYFKPATKFLETQMNVCALVKSRKIFRTVSRNIFAKQFFSKDMVRVIPTCTGSHHGKLSSLVQL